MDTENSANSDMHDWALASVVVDWTEAIVRLLMRAHPDRQSAIEAKGLRKLMIPRSEAWGPSDSIYGHTGPDPCDGTWQRLVILMQTGDECEIVAREILTPSALALPTTLQ